MEGGWNTEKEKLLCFVVLDDVVAEVISEGAGTAFFRAFVVQDRESGVIQARFRFHYKNGEKSWHEIKPRDQTAETVERLKAGFKLMLDEAARRMNINLPDGAVTFHEPPDDGGDGARTIMWLEMQDLIEFVSVELAERPVEQGDKE